MTYAIEWYREPHILQVWYEGNLTEAELIEAAREINALLDHPDQKHYLMVDFTGLKKVPLDIIGLSNAFSQRHQDLRITLVYGLNMVVDVIAKSVLRVINQKDVHFVKNQEAALQKIRELDPEISTLL